MVRLYHPLLGSPSVQHAQLQVSRPVHRLCSLNKQGRLSYKDVSLMFLKVTWEIPLKKTQKPISA